jgi:hypothetical protein
VLDEILEKIKQQQESKKQPVLSLSKEPTGSKRLTKQTEPINSKTGKGMR